MNTQKYEGPVTVGIELITPEIAQAALRFNESNRPLSRKRVELYKRDMNAGNWQLNGETISFYDSGELKDGQHRLAAIAESGKPQWVVVVRNIPGNVVIADRGKTRNVGNILDMAGYPAPVRQTNVVGAINLLNQCCTGRNMLTDAEVTDFVDKYGQILTKAWQACVVGAERPVCKKSVVIAALFCALYSNVPEDVLVEFCRVTNTGFCDTDKKYAAIVLRNYLLQIDTSGSRLAREKSFYTAMQAIEDFASGTPRRKAYNPSKKSKYLAAVRQGIFNLEE